jgi:hypothetical protein
MSTRASILIKDEFSEQWFYRHSDGYPDGTLPTLRRFMDYVKTGAIRDNTSQAAGWLIIIGFQEYADGECGRSSQNTHVRHIAPADSSMGWKAGAYEPADGPNDWGAYEYELDLDKKRIRYRATGIKRWDVDK